MGLKQKSTNAGNSDMPKTNLKVFLLKVEGPSGIVAYVQDCDIVVSSHSSCAIMFTFRLTLLGKVLPPYLPQL